MNTKIRYIIAITLIFNTLVGSAQAISLNWLISRDMNIDTTQDTNWSFNNIFTAIKGSSVASEPESINNDSVVASSVTSLNLASVNKISNKKFAVRATGYSSTVDQTDSTPFITASGTFVRDGIIAANFLPMGTRIKIPELYGDKQFIVEDRMNSRYWYNIDIWFPSRSEALSFGAKMVTIEVIGF